MFVKGCRLIEKAGRIRFEVTPTSFLLRGLFLALTVHYQRNEKYFHLRNAHGLSAETTTPILVINCVGKVIE